MATVWITYAWEDNRDGDVDFAAQELVNTGVGVKIDHWNLQAGKRLWEQIERFITSPSGSDAWVLYATSNSLGSESCKEEFSYALDRALQSRGEDFPIIGLFPATVDQDLIPAAIRTRLYVSLTDPDWKERIKAAAEGLTPKIDSPLIEPYSLHIHERISETRRYWIEVRPRAGTWSPFIAAIPLEEKERVDPDIRRGPGGRIPQGSSSLSGYTDGRNGQWWAMSAQDEATPTQSYYVGCRELPSELMFGVRGGEPKYTKKFDCSG